MSDSTWLPHYMMFGCSCVSKGCKSFTTMQPRPCWLQVDVHGFGNALTSMTLYLCVDYHSVVKRLIWEHDRAALDGDIDVRMLCAWPQALLILSSAFRSGEKSGADAAQSEVCLQYVQ